MLAVLALLPLCLTGRALLTGGLYAPIDIAYTSEPLASLAEQAGVTRVLNPTASDVFSQFLPWREALRDALRHRQWPLWNRFDLGGHPLLGAAQVAPFHPVTIAGLLLPPEAEPAFTASMLYLLAALSMFILLRDLNVDELAAIFGAAAWMTATYLVSFAGTAHGMSVSVAPLVLAAAGRVARRPARRTLLLLTAALLLLLMSGHPETTLHVVALATAFFFFEWLPRRDGKAIVAGLAAGAATLLISAIYLFPVLDTLEQTRDLAERAADRKASAGPAELSHRLRVNLLPFLEGAHGEPATHESGTSHGWFSTSYAGTLLFAPAIYALVFARDRRRWFFAAAAAFGIAAGVKAPGVADVLELLPGFSIAINERMLWFAALSVCALAGIGLEEFRKERRHVLALLFGLTAFVFAIAFVLARPAIEAAALSNSFVRIQAVRMLLPLALAAGIALAVRPRRHAVIALIAILLVQRASEDAMLQPSLPERAWYPHIAALDQLAQRNDVFRIVALDVMLPPNIAAHYGLEDVRGYEAMMHPRVAETQALWSVPQPVWSNRVMDLSAPMLSLLNVRYALAPPRSAPPEGWHAAANGSGFELFENEHVLPRAFLPRVIHLTSRAKALQGVASCRDFAAEGWVESGREATMTNGSGDVRIARRGADLTVDVSMREPGWLFLSENGWRGWRVREGGRDLPISPANDSLLAVRLGSGPHHLAVTFRPRAFIAGRAVTAVTMLVLLLVGVFYVIPSSAITSFMSCHTSFFAAGVRSR